MKAKVVCHLLVTIWELIRNDSHRSHAKRAYQTNSSGDVWPTKVVTIVIIGGLSNPFYEKN